MPLIQQALLSHDVLPDAILPSPSLSRALNQINLVSEQAEFASSLLQN
jgi:hypothetical protein